MTKEELLSKTGHSLRMKDLREFVEKNKEMGDDAPVIVEHVTDTYFQDDVLKVEGYDYHSSLEWNEKMRKEIEFRKVGEGEYEDALNPLEAIFGEKELEEMKEQFYQPHCITTDKEIVYIYNHY